MKSLIWAVPISSDSPFLAHLLDEGDKRGTTHRLCRPTFAVGFDYAVIVDSEYYRPKCKTCMKLRKNHQDVPVVIANRPTLRTSQDVALAKHGRPA